MNRKIATKSHLEKQRSEADRGYHYQCRRTVKSVRPGIDHNQGEREK